MPWSRPGWPSLSKNVIHDMRKDLGVPALPFVIAEPGMTGPEEKNPRALSLIKAQASVAEHPEFKGNVAFVGTKAFWRPQEQSPNGQGLSLELECRDLLPHRRGHGRGDEAAPRRQGPLGGEPAPGGRRETHENERTTPMKTTNRHTHGELNQDDPGPEPVLHLPGRKSGIYEHLPDC